MKFRLKKLLALMLVVQMVFQFGGAAGVSAIDKDAFSERVLNKESSIEAANDPEKPTISTWESSEVQELSRKGDLSHEELKTAVLEDADVPKVISKESIEELGHVNRLYEQETDLNNIVFQNRNGTKTMYQFDMAVKYIDVDGKIKDKSNKVSPIKEDSKYAFVNQENDIQTYFPKTLDTGIKTINGKTEITIIPTTDKKLDSKDLLNVAEEKNTIEYYGAFGKDTILRYTPDYNGYKEDLILDSYQGENQFSFIVKTNGLSLVEGNGALVFLDPLTGEKIGNIGNLIIYDSGKSEDKAEYNHRYVIKKIKTDEEYLLTILVDEAFLKSETTVYPVVIDPTLTIDNSLTGSNYIQDASIHLKDTQTNFNSPYNMRIGYTSSPADTYRIVMKSDNLVSNMSVIPSSNNITSAYLYVNNVDYYTGAEMRIRAYRVTKAWNETTVKCNSLWNEYTDGEGYNDYETSSAASGYKGYTITNMVKKWKAGTATNNGVMLKAELESSPRGWIAMASSEYSTTNKRPYLVIEYTTVVDTTKTISITNIPTNALINGQSHTLGVSVTPSGTVTWSYSPNYIVNINSSGVITALSNGTTTVTASSPGANSVSFDVTVYNPYDGNNVSFINNTSSNFYIRNVKSGRYLDVKDRSTANHTPVHIWDATENTNQKWRFKYLGDGYYAIRSHSDMNLVLAIENSSTSNWAEIEVQYVSTVDNGIVPINAQWYINYTGKGSYSIVSRNGGKVLDCFNGNTDNGTQVIQYEYNMNDLNMRWTFEYIDERVPYLWYLYDFNNYEFYYVDLVDSGGHLDYTSSSKYSSELAASITRWNEVATGVIRADTSSTINDVNISDEYNESEGAYAGVTELGILGTGEGSIRLNTYYLDQFDTYEKQHVIMHELGHALGLGHNVERKYFCGNVMHEIGRSHIISFSREDKASFYKARDEHY